MVEVELSKRLVGIHQPFLFRGETRDVVPISLLGCLRLIPIGELGSSI